VVTHNDDATPDYTAMAARLDRLQQVPTDVLTTVVERQGLCLSGLWLAVEPDEEDDRALAQRLCEGCPVIDECLELELRIAGARTTGVWGALPEDDRRALHRVWQQHRQHHDQDQGDRDGGTRP
jgi:WhiB family redox-sensing transcriptional regulator